MERINHISCGVSRQRVEDFRKQTRAEERPLVLKKIVRGCFAVTFVILMAISILL